MIDSTHGLNITYYTYPVDYSFRRNIIARYTLHKPTNIEQGRMRTHFMEESLLLCDRLDRKCVVLHSSVPPGHSHRKQRDNKVLQKDT